MIVAKLTDLPSEYACKLCGKTKPVAEMVVVRRRELNGFHLRPRCKECHNKKERGHRRDWKRKYQQKWRAKNPKLYESYWKDDDQSRERSRVSALRWYNKNRDALAIRRRLAKGGISVSVEEANDMLKQYGVCYPSLHGLTPEGLKQCERIREQMRQRNSHRLAEIEICMMVYEDGFFIKPSRQIKLCKKAAKRRNGMRKQEASRKAA